MVSWCPYIETVPTAECCPQSPFFWHSSRDTDTRFRSTLSYRHKVHRGYAGHVLCCHMRGKPIYSQLRVHCILYNRLTHFNLDQIGGIPVNNNLHFWTGKIINLAGFFKDTLCLLMTSSQVRIMARCRLDKWSSKTMMGHFFDSHTPTEPRRVDTLRRRQNGGHFADDTFKCIFLNENIWISNKISMKYVPMGVTDNMLALVQIMAWRRPGAKLLSEPMLTQFIDAYMRH